MRVHDSLDTCLLEVLENAANDDCIVRETMHPWKMALSGSFFGQVLLFIKVDRPDGPKIHTVRKSLISGRATMDYLSEENCNANLPKFRLPIGAGLFNL
jgi:hypothetical protein